VGASVDGTPVGYKPQTNEEVLNSRVSCVTRLNHLLVCLGPEQRNDYKSIIGPCNAVGRC